MIWAAGLASAELNLVASDGSVLSALAAQQRTTTKLTHPFANCGTPISPLSWYRRVLIRSPGFAGSQILPLDPFIVSTGAAAKYRKTGKVRSCRPGPRENRTPAVT
jgi:hypothetical protein